MLPHHILESGSEISFSDDNHRIQKLEAWRSQILHYLQFPALFTSFLRKFASEISFLMTTIALKSWRLEEAKCGICLQFLAFFTSCLGKWLKNIFLGPLHSEVSKTKSKDFHSEVVPGNPGWKIALLGFNKKQEQHITRALFTLAIWQISSILHILIEITNKIVFS